MQNEINKKIEELQEKCFGSRYVGASLSQFSFSKDIDEGILRWVKNPADFLVVIGPKGCGKTHLCSALLAILYFKFKSFRAYNERDLLRRIRLAISEQGSGDYLDYLHGFIDDEMLEVDDLCSSGHNEWRGEIVFELIDYRYRKKMPTVITMNLKEYEFSKEYGGRSASRLFAKNNLIIDLDGFSDLRKDGK